MNKPKEVINSEKIILEMQAKVVRAFHAISDKNINDEVNWVRPAGGGGKSITIINKHIEKAACNFSSITDVKLPSASLAPKINNSRIGRFYATGLSVISHPVNLKVPTSHLNIRIFKIFDKKGSLSDFWCGGGYDLTPYFTFKADTNLWHKNAKNCLDGFNKYFYRKFPMNCDEYFFLSHRNEKRGISGIFFDSLKLEIIDKCLGFLISVVESYIYSHQKIT